jgi:hypothetical protein
MLFDGGQQMLESDTGQKDHDIDLAGNNSVSKVDCFSIFGNRNLSQRGANEGLAPEFLDHSLHFLATTAFEGGDAQTVKTRLVIRHAKILGHFLAAG